MALKRTSNKRSTEQIDDANKDEEHLLSGIKHVGIHDCLCGRGGHATNHPGNVAFRVLVSKYKDCYMGLSRYGKLQVAAEVVKLWRSQSPPGRFLAMTDPANRETTTWHDIGDKEAIKKTSQCLRERIPPNQKARTLEQVSKKAKALRKEHLQNQQQQRTKQKCQADEKRSEEEEDVTSMSASETMNDGGATNCTSNAHDDASSSQFSVWEKAIQDRITLNEDCEPTPILEPATVSLHSTSASASPTPSSASTDQINFLSVSAAPLGSAEKGEMPPLITPPQPQHPICLSSSGTPTTSMSQRNYGGGLQRETSIAPSIGSWAPSEDFDFAVLADIFEKEDPEANSNTTTKPHHRAGHLQQGNHGHSRRGSNLVDALLIPSAANLTKDVFDDDIYKPLITSIAKANSVIRDAVHQPGGLTSSLAQGQCPNTTTLNQSLELNNLFSF